MGTSGGIGVKPGTLIVTERAFSPLLKVFYVILLSAIILLLLHNSGRISAYILWKILLFDPKK